MPWLKPQALFCNLYNWEPESIFSPCYFGPFLQTCIRNLIGDWPVKSWGHNLQQSSGGSKTSLQQFREDPSSLAIELEPLRCEEAAKDFIIKFQVRRDTKQFSVNAPEAHGRGGWQKCAGLLLLAVLDLLLSKPLVSHPHT